MGNGFAAAFANRHTVAGDFVPVDRPVDGAARPIRRAPDEGQIAALERSAAAAVARELRRQRLVRAVVLCHHHQSARILVEPVDDARPPLAANAGQARAAMGDERIDQRTGPMPGGRMHDQPFGLVDDDDVVVLINHVQRNGLGSRLGRCGFRNVDDDGGAGIDAVAGITDRAPIDDNGTGLDQRLQPRPRKLGDTCGKHAVEPSAGLAVQDVDRFLRESHRNSRVPVWPN